MDFLKVIKILERKNLPIPAISCQNCMGIIYKKDHWFQCPDCGTLSTSYGGFYYDKNYPVSITGEWKNWCMESKLILDENVLKSGL